MNEVAMRIFLLIFVLLLFSVVGALVPGIILYFIFLNFFGIFEQWPIIVRLTYIILCIIMFFTIARISVKR